MDISRRLLIALGFTLFSMLFTWQVVNLTRDWTLQHIHRQGSDELLNVISQLRAALDEYRYLPFLISQDTDVRELILSSTEERSEEVSLYLEQTNLVAGSSSLFLLNRNGRVTAYSHWRDEQDFYLRSHQDQAYFQQAKSGHRGRQFSLNPQTRSPAYYLSSPIYDGTRFSGAAVVRIELQRLVSKLRSTGALLLQDNSGVLFYSSAVLSRFKPMQQQVQIETIPLSDGISAEVWQAQGRHWLARSVRLDDLDWQVTVLNDASMVQKNIRHATLFSLGGCLAFGLLGLLLRERQLKLRSQNETRAALARSEAQQKAIINNAQVGLLLVNAQGRITFANEMALQQFAVSMALIINKPVIELLVAEGETPLARMLGRLGEKGFAPLVGYEAVGNRGDGSQFPLMISVRKMQGQQPPQFLVTLIDISRRKGLELALQSANESLEQKVEARTQALKEAQEELVQAGKLAVLGRMSTAVVHELNQPLTAIRNYVAICKQLTAQPEMLAESLLEIEDLTQRMAQITSQLKTYAFKKPEQTRPVSLQLVIEQSLQLFRQRLADEAVQLELNLPAQGLYVMGDNARLEQVLVNLIKNALDAMQEQQRKVLTIRLKGSARPELEVMDTGSGISPQMLPQLFDPFATSKPIGEGLGLGLAIVKSIVRDLGGDISAENREGGGACFRLWLPPCQAQVEVEESYK
ncbi:ATP-binding protein [Neptuniibacter halophilus]|uniref:ATP-binding protein n=1 Tax=Neptuniibacter halophilus TaxID=651666 RepID=UPI0025731BC4|nr:ATP-binding protein [Neptuniibacter halophilus]